MFSKLLVINSSVKIRKAPNGENQIKQKKFQT